MSTSRFRTVRSIDVDAPSTWQDQFFLMFDLDWASNDVIEYTLHLVADAGVAATWFVTHHTPLLRQLANCHDFELGIHPNFSPLLIDGCKCKGENARDVVASVMGIVPGDRPVSVRCHSLTQSSQLLDVFSEFQLRFDCNELIPASSGIALQPWRHWHSSQQGMIRVPVFWEDDIHYTAGWSHEMEGLCAVSGLKAFAFHPIHVALNTPSEEHYRQAKAAGAEHSWRTLKRHIHKGHGARTQLECLLRIK